VQRDVLRPLRPGRAAVLEFQGHEESEIVQPGGVRRTEGQIAGARLEVARLQEARLRAPQHPVLVRDDGAIVHPVRGKGRPVGKILGGEQALGTQSVQTDEQRVAGERREGLVRGVAIAGGAERQHLPEALAGPGAKVDKGPRPRAQIPDAVGAGHAGRMAEDAAHASRFHRASFAGRSPQSQRASVAGMIASAARPGNARSGQRARRRRRPGRGSARVPARRFDRIPSSA